MHVRAVVVTYNRKALLAQCLEAVLTQTHPVDHVHVIDNASTDGTSEFLSERGLLDREGIDLRRLPENLGGSGGFAQGIAEARREESDWLWVMDDDCAPRPDALERLLAAPPAADGRTVTLCPMVVYATGGVDVNQRGHFRGRLRPLPPSAYVPGSYPSLGYMSFVGSLIRSDVAQHIDPPKAEFFVWGDDVEYSLRLRRHGEIRLVPDSVVEHHRSAHTYSTPRSRFWNAVLPVELHPTPLERFWQPLCGLRNYLWMKRVYEGQSTLSAAGTTLQFVAKHLLYDGQPLRRIPWVLRYARRGRQGDFHNIPPARWAEMVRRGEI